MILKVFLLAVSRVLPGETLVSAMIAVFGGHSTNETNCCKNTHDQEDIIHVTRAFQLAGHSFASLHTTHKQTHTCVPTPNTFD